MKITYDVMFNELTKVVDQKGRDYRYPVGERMDEFGICRYVYNGKPDCIAGHVYHSLGMTLEDLSKFEGIAIDGTKFSLKDDEGHYLVTLVTEKAEFLLRRAQQKQDDGLAWGEAFDDAVEYIHGLRFNEDEYYAPVSSIFN